MARFKIWQNTAEFMNLDGIRPEAMNQLYLYWKSRCPDNDVPRQKDLAIQEMPECIKNIALLDLSQEEHRAKYIIVGEALKTLLGADPTGQYIDKIYSASIYEEISAAFRKAATTKAALYYRREFQILTKSFGYDRLILPLRLDGDAVRRLLVCIYPLDTKLTRAEQWQQEVQQLEKEARLENEIETAWAESLGYSVVKAEEENETYLLTEKNKV